MLKKKMIDELVLECKDQILNTVSLNTANTISITD